MDKQEILMMLNNRCGELLGTGKKYELISNILSEEDWFKKIDVETGLNLLVDLGYEENTAYNMFTILMSK